MNHILPIICAATVAIRDTYKTKQVRKTVFNANSLACPTNIHANSACPTYSRIPTRNQNRLSQPQLPNFSLPTMTTLSELTLLGPPHRRCEISCPNQSILASHLRMLHAEFFYCPYEICAAWFCRQDDLLTHMKTEHNWSVSQLRNVGLLAQRRS